MSIDKVVRYWRDSLLDADLAALDLTPENHISIPKHVLHDGVLDPRSLTKLKGRFPALAPKAANGADEGNDESGAEAIPVLLVPTVAVKNRSRAYRGRRQVVCPVFIPALLSQNGFLDVDPKNRMPWIPRTLLEPTMSDMVLGTVGEFTAYLDANELEEHGDPRDAWAALEAYAWQMFVTVAGEDWRATLENADFRILEDAALLPVSVMRGISANIVKVYDAMRERREYPPLITTYAELDPPLPQPVLAEELWEDPAKQHLGSFSNKFPLSSSQRQAVNHFLTLPADTALAISGPPGTGKTTLLHSVIASLWVKAAVHKEPPPVIVASSTNNQAVTNVIESLSGSGDMQRWIDVGSFGLYLVNSQDKRNDAEDRGILTVDSRGNGFPDEVQKRRFVEQALVDFLNNCCTHFDRSFSDLGEAVDALHAELVSTARALEDGLSSAYELRRLKDSALQVSQGHENLQRAMEALEQKMMQPRAELAHWQALAELWNASQKEAGLVSRLKFLPNVRQKEQERQEAFVAEHLPHFDPQSSSREIQDHIHSEQARAQERVERLKREAAEIKQLSAELNAAEERWRAWCQQQDAPQLEVEALFVLESADGSANGACLHNWLDTTLRYRLFALATHYWEGRWLQTVIEKKIARSTYYESQGRSSQEEKWRRYAMLTPCFVTTMHSGPRFFDYYDGEAHPLLDFIDLLIVDEAGQVTPEVSGAMFALAKQALVVGDIQQIEPVWSVPQQVDRGNLEWIGILKSQAEWESVHQKGLTASSGSVMQMAQSVSPYQIPSANGVQYERGMFLAEHRRCVPEVIGYCNELAYQGRLRPMRPSVKSYPWPHLGYAHVKGISSKDNGSRKNDREAQTIVGWIAENRNKLEAYYSEKGGKPVELENIIGIVTPFAAQKRTLQSMLEQSGISLSKVGTVHALQGGERPLVIFSPVYSSRDGRSFFFDQGPNMLNVAVSRAKDSFLVFGDMDILDPALTTPSGILARYLFADENNELAGFALPQRSSNGDPREQVHLVNSLSMHIGTLSRAFERASAQLVIVSPYLRRRAVEADGLAEKVADAVGRGVAVTVYVDDHFNDQLAHSSAAAAAAALTQAGAEVKMCHNIHSKVLCIDHDIFVEGSFNWLSAERRESNYVRHEISMIYMGPQAGDFIRETVTDLEAVVVNQAV